MVYGLGLGLGGALALGGCWKTDRAELPEGTVDFDPAAAAVEGWIVERLDLPYQCPDGENSAYYLVYPEGNAGPLPVAVVLHSGPFDYVIAPPATDPLAGDHFQQDESRLSSEWAVRRVFATLGLVPDEDRFEDHLGALPAVLAQNGVAMVIPANCWGDWWHNEQGAAENDFVNDRYYRNGRAAAEWAYQIASEPGFAPANRVDLPTSFDPDQVYLIGLGEGGRGVGELLGLGYTPTAIFVDSSADDLRPYFDDPQLYGPIATGLARIYPEGRDSTTATSLASVPTLPPTAYFYSSLDTQIPAGAHDAVLARLNARSGDLVLDAAVQRHVLTGTDLLLAQQAVAFLVGDGGSDTDGGL